MTPLAAVQRIRSAETPEALARELSAQAIAANQMSFWMYLALFLP